MSWILRKYFTPKPILVYEQFINVLEVLIIALSKNT